MTFLWAEMKKNLRRRLRDPLALALWAGIPLLIAAMIASMSGSGPTLALLVVDEDQSRVSRAVVTMLGRMDEDRLAIETVDARADGRRRLEDGAASALLVLPAGFGDAVLRRDEAAIVLLTNPSERVMPRVAEEGAGALTDGVFYLQGLLGEPVPTDLGGIAHRLGDLVAEHVPAQLSLEIAERQSGSPFLPGILFMALIFAAQGLSEDLWAERDAGAFRRMVATPQRGAVVYAGKFAASLVVVGAVAVLTTLLGATSPQIAAAAWLWSIAGGAVLLALFFLIQLYAGSKTTGRLLTVMVMFPALMVGGSFFPFEMMPDAMAAVGRLTPNGMALDGLREILSGEVHGSGLAVRLSVLLTVASAAVLFGARRFERRFTRV